MSLPLNRECRFGACISGAILLKTSSCAPWTTTREGPQMAVYKRNYTAYTGTVTPVWTRVLVLARYAFEEAWSSKITVGLFIFCLLPCILTLLVIYLADNPTARALIGGRGQIGRA